MEIGRQIFFILHTEGFCNSQKVIKKSTVPCDCECFMESHLIFHFTSSTLYRSTPDVFPACIKQGERYEVATSAFTIKHQWGDFGAFTEIAFVSIIITYNNSLVYVVKPHRRCTREDEAARSKSGEGR